MPDDLIDGDEYDPAVQESNDAVRAKEAEDASKAALNALDRRRIAYVMVFGGGSPSAQDREIVLNDLVAFCRGEETTFHENERIHALLTGRQEVYMRIKDHTRLTLDALYAKYNPPKP